MDIFLFEVSACSITPEGLALWPGVPMSRVAEPAIGQLQQGSILELDREGHRERVIMEHYFVEGVTDDATGDTIFVNNIIVVISNESGAEIEAGTKVFLKY